LALIRSFFDRFRPAHAVCAANCENFFACEDVGVARNDDDSLRRSRKIFSDPGGLCVKSAHTKNHYFIGCFAMFAVCDRCARRAIASAATSRD